MMPKWIVVNVGCLECGVSSAIVGVFTNKERAEAVAGACADEFSWREGGQNSFEVFGLPADDVIATEYGQNLEAA